MNLYDDFMNDNTPDGQGVPSMPPVDESEEKTPGSQREDASKWDQFTDAQRKLIVFGVLLAVILVLALVTGIGSSCGDGCGSCALCAGKDISGSDVVADDPVHPDGPDRVTSSDSDTVPPGGEISIEPEFPGEEPEAEPDIPAQEPDDEPAAATGEPEEATTDESEETIADEAETSDTDAVPDTPAGDGDVEYIEVVQPSGFSACVHHADNEAGDQTEATGSGFLGFLFGCSGKGCNLDVSEGLTDPVDGDDPTRLDGMSISGADAENNMWAAQPDDDAYIEMLRGELAHISDSMIQLSGLDLALSQYTDPQRVRENDRFRKISEEMLIWCAAAEGYDSSLLAGDQAKNCNQLSLRLAEDLRTYLNDYPLLITGATSGTDILSMDQQINNVMGDIVELFAALNPAAAGVQAPNEQPAQ